MAFRHGNPALAQVAYSREAIRARVAQLADEIQRDFPGERLLMVSVLQGSVIFLADLVRHIPSEVDVDFLSTSSYRADKKPAGVVKIIKDLEFVLEERHVILVEDIVDTGLTLAFILRTLEARDPKSISVCTLIDKPVRRIAQPPITYCGFRTEDFLVGYGLDFKGKYRNLPDLIAISDPGALTDNPDLLDSYFQRP